VGLTNGKAKADVPACGKEAESGTARESSSEAAEGGRDRSDLDEVPLIGPASEPANS
jgi:hypothetical protein